MAGIKAVIESYKVCFKYSDQCKGCHYLLYRDDCQTRLDQDVMAVLETLEENEDILAQMEDKLEI